MSIIRRIGLALLLALTIAVALPASATKAATTFTWSASSDTTVSQLSNVDIRPMIVTNGATFYEIYSDGANNVKRLLCSSLDSCTPQTDGVLDSSFNHPYGDDRYWLGGGILYGSTYYAIVHIEFRYHSTLASNFSWFRRMGIATSTDQGAHWHYLGDVITSDFSTDIADFTGAPAFQVGGGDPSLFADWAHSMVYVSYTTFWADVTTGARSEQTNIARCPMSDIGSVTCWHKWDYGNWTQPGLGGHNAAIFPGQDNASISWDNYLGEYIAVGHSTNNVSYITTSTSMDSQNWQPLQHFVTDSELYWYTWLVAPNGDPFNLGATIRVYSSQNSYGGVQSKYFTLTLAIG